MCANIRLQPPNNDSAQPPADPGEGRQARHTVACLIHPELVDPGTLGRRLHHARAGHRVRASQLKIFGPSKQDLCAAGVK